MWHIAADAFAKAAGIEINLVPFDGAATAVTNLMGGHVQMVPVSLEGIEKAKRDVEKLSETAVDILYSLPGSNDFLEDLIKVLVSREK